jgi:hypothetical protein
LSHFRNSAGDEKKTGGELMAGNDGKGIREKGKRELG